MSFILLKPRGESDMKGYLANGLFSEADRHYNNYIARVLREKFPLLELFLPQEQLINDKNTYADSVMISDMDAKNLLESDFLIAILDGVEIDSGVSAEVGIFWTTGKPIIGLYTDIRQHGRSNDEKIQALIDDGTENQFMYRNLMTVGLIKKRGVITSDALSLVNAIKERVK